MCRFNTERLLVREWHSCSAVSVADQALAQVVCVLLTPSVTQSLPERWQGEYTTERASQWIEERDGEGTTLLVLDRLSGTPIGLMILFENDDDPRGRIVRLGYLLAESAWGKGLASELVRGFVEWCRTVDIASIVSGVERDNVASQRVLEKNGFVLQQDKDDSADLFLELRI